ncbi:hypothetical protein COB64_04200 [Candidatus Wolfebacteria bacterium]|nr:MAG: hypothetical protein COB64_04200 [Candidatus Wolfebacteria bacterium]
MYDLEGSDSDREWIEITNTGSNDIDLSTWKFYENTTNHALTPFQGGNLISPGDFAVIVDKAETFLIDWPNFLGLIFDSSFSLSNSGEVLEIRDSDLLTIHQVTYSSADGAQGDGNSLQISGNDISSGVATPGAGSSGGGSGGSGSGSGSSGSGSSIPPPVIYGDSSSSLSAQIIASTTVVAGVITNFESNIKDVNGATLTQGKYYWNFGDFITREGDRSQKFTHTYEYPGDYVVVLEYYKKVNAKEPDAIDRRLIKVIPANIEISSVGDEDNFFIELSNTGSYELDLSKWVVRVGSQSFSIPRNTIMLPKKKVFFSPKATGFTYSDEKVEIVFPGGEVASSFGGTVVEDTEKVSEEVVVPAPTVMSSTQPYKEPSVVEIDVESDSSKTNEDTSEQVEEGELSPSEVLFNRAAQAQTAAVGNLRRNSSSNKEKDSSNLFMWISALIGVIIISSSSVLFLRKGSTGEHVRSHSLESDDIELID